MTATPEPTPDTPVVVEPTIEDVRAAFFAKVKAASPTRRVHFSFGGESHWADLIGFGISAEQLAQVNAAEASQDTDSAEQAAFIKCRILADSVGGWSFPVPCEYDEIKTWPLYMVDSAFEQISKASDSAAPKDRQPAKKATSRKR